MSAVRSSAAIGLLSLNLSASQGVSLGDFLLAPASPIEKLLLKVAFLYLTLGSETEEGVAEDKSFARTGNRTPGPKPSTLPARLSLHSHES